MSFVATTGFRPRAALLAAVLAIAAPLAAASARADQAPEPLLTLTVLVSDGMLVFWHGPDQADELALTLSGLFSGPRLAAVPVSALRLDHILFLLELESVRRLTVRAEVFRRQAPGRGLDELPRYRLRALELWGYLPPLGALEADPEPLALRYGWRLGRAGPDPAPTRFGGLTISSLEPLGTAVVGP